jgi:mannose-6-phosphate isomerase
MVNVVRPYDWGSRHILARLQGRTPAGNPEAELWVGAHPSAPSQLIDPTGRSFSLTEAIAADPAGTLGPRVRDRFGDRLPFLMKILAIERALSIQVHPSPEQARAGFALEAGSDQDGRTYVDPYPKPELLYAVSPLQALAGLRPPREAGRMLDLLDTPVMRGIRQELADGLTEDRRSATLGVMLALATWPQEERAPLVAEVAAASRRALAHPRIERDPPALSAVLWVLRLCSQHPVDPLVLAPLLMPIHELQRGETLYLPAGVPHAYLAGTAVEIMGSSDNVVRAGLTSKKVDARALAEITDPTAPGALAMEPIRLSAHEYAWRPPAEEFQLTRVTVVPGTTSTSLLDLAPLDGPQILLCLEGAVVLHTDGQRVALSGGTSAFVAAGSAPVRLSGEGVVFRAAVA